MLDKRGARHGRRRAARFKSSSAQASAGGGGALTWWTSLPSVVLRRSLKRRATVRVRFYVAFAASTTRCGGLVLVLVVAFTVLGVDPYLGVGSISDSLSLDDIITRDEKRELLRTRDRVAAEVFEVLHLVLREVPALVSYRREILVDGSRGFLLFVEAANIYFIFPI